MTFSLPPYLQWRNGRPRWVPGPRLRPAFRGRDLKDDAGQWLGLEAAIAAAKKLNDEVRTGRLPEGVSVRTNKKATRTVEHLWQMYASPGEPDKAAKKWRNLAASTRRDYTSKLGAFVDEFGDIPVGALSKADLFAWWERLEIERGHAMANGILACVRAMLSYAVLRGWIKLNPAKELGIEQVPPRVAVWPPSLVEAFIAKADELGHHGVADGVVIALHTGQRQGDVLSFELESSDGGRCRFKQSKTGARVSVPQTPQLAARIGTIKARRRAGQVAELTLTGSLVRDTRDLPYRSRHFHTHFALVRAAVANDHPAVLALQFLDLRDTAITRLALAGATVPEIRAITGHSLDTIHKVLAHYLALDDRMADAAIRKLKIWMEREGIAI